MRIARIQTSEGPRLAVQQDERWLAAAPAGVTLPQMLARGAAFKAEGPELEGEVLAPLIPGKIVAIGLNYMDHIRERFQKLHWYLPSSHQALPAQTVML